jgi:hypothetical protein
MALCAECGSKCAKKTGEDVYPHREDLAHLVIWVCQCGARVGCHPGTDTALGTAAGSELRAVRMNAHKEFDRLWKTKMLTRGLSKREARNAGYAWLAKEMGMTTDECHIGMMNKSHCIQVVNLCMNLLTLPTP